MLKGLRGGGCKAAVVTNTHTIAIREVITICLSEYCFDITVILERLVPRSPPSGIPCCTINNYLTTKKTKEVT